MENKMKRYLGDLYTENHLHNFIRYWMKAAEGSGDAWRKKNDLDCLYFGGDLRADTLMSAWTPVKWVADCLNREYGKQFYKRRKDTKDPHHDLKLLLEDTEAYLPPKHELVQLLNEFLELAEQRCNYILLPDRQMNPDRYRIERKGGETLWLFDEVPALLYHIFMRDTLEKYFTDFYDAVRWVEREHLEIGYTQEPIAPLHVRPLVPGMRPGEAKWLTEEREIAEALKYMIRFLKERKVLLQEQEETALSVRGQQAKTPVTIEGAPMETSPAGSDSEELVYEVICYLKKWKLWDGRTGIYAGGKEYCYQTGRQPCFCGLEDVTEKEGGDIQEKMKVYIGDNYEDRGIYVRRANPQQIFDMYIGERVSQLLLEKVYRTKTDPFGEGKMTEQMISEFNEILARHRLRYEMISRQHLSCYRI